MATMREAMTWLEDDLKAADRELNEKNARIEELERELAECEADVRELTESLEDKEDDENNARDEGRAQSRDDALEIMRDCERGLYSLADTIDRLEHDLVASG